jgi:signal transduction histidine kinase
VTRFTRYRAGIPPWRAASAWATAFAAALLLLLWARELQPVLLGLTALTVVAAVVLVAGGLRAARMRGTKTFFVALLAVVVGVASGIVAAHRFNRIEFEWERLQAERHAQLSGLLERRMSVVVQRGQRAAELAGDIVGRDRWALFRDLETIRDRTGVDALAVFSETGELVAWAGEHRGRIPEQARQGDPPIAFEERALFSYLYFATPPRERGRHAVAMALVESGLTTSDGETPAVTAAFASRTDTRAAFRAGGSSEAAWSLVIGGDTVVHAQLERVSQADRRAAVANTARRHATLTALLALLLLSIAWMRARRPDAQWASAVPLAVFIIAFALAPLGAALGLRRLFSPLLFLLPVPGDVTLGVALALLIPVAALAAALRTPVLARRGFVLALAGGVVAVGFGFPAALRLVRDAAAPPLLEGGAALWIGLQLVGTLILTVLAVLAMPRYGRVTLLTGKPLRSKPGALVYAGAALLLSAGLGIMRGWSASPTWVSSDLMAVAWAAPFLLFAVALAPYGGQSGRLVRWLAAGWLASSAVLPAVWDAHVRARLAAAERELATLGMRPDVYLEFLLYEFGREAQLRHGAGEDGLLLLYRSWVASGLAREPYSARILLWSTDEVIEYELGLGGAPEIEAYHSTLAAVARLRAADPEPRVAQSYDLPGVNRVLTAPLDDGRVVMTVVPPRRSLQAPTGVAPFLGAAVGGETRLTLVPVRAPVPPAGEPYWIEAGAGWRSESIVRYPDGDYHAHIEVRVMPVGMRLARASLLVALNLIVLTVLWAIGNAARGSPPVPRGGWRPLFASFRARITLALFGFFLLPTAIFGWVAYGALAGEVARAARMVAERAAAIAVAEFPDVAGDLRELAQHAGSDVLYYFYGELANVSSPEALDLGVYDAWMPPDVFRALQSGEEASAVGVHRLGRQEFLTAYHSMLPVGTLAVPFALTAGDTALRQREMLHLVLFAVLVGALLSFGLSVVVGRTLAGPIAQLRRGAAAIGAGNLKVRLPERGNDEFAQVFASFNRMVRRLRRARARELRTERVLAWGEMARQIAHEIKNPLTPIKLSVQHLRRARADRRPDFDDILETSVTEILREIDRLSEIARAFSRYGAPVLPAGPLDAVDVGGVIREALTLYRASEPRARYLEAVEPGLPRVQARADELKEVLLNLLENARVALDEEGTVIVSARRLDSMVEVEVSDNGPGIAPELLARIFEPHFSTRSSGTGLGLPIVRRLVESWGGSVGAESGPDGGATLRMRIPIVSARGN